MTYKHILFFLKIEKNLELEYFQRGWGWEGRTEKGESMEVYFLL